jgi:hypothetical protein
MKARGYGRHPSVTEPSCAPDTPFLRDSIRRCPSFSQYAARIQLAILSRHIRAQLRGMSKSLLFGDRVMKHDLGVGSSVTWPVWSRT